MTTAEPSDGPGASPGFLLWRTTLRWQRAIAEGLRPLGLTHVQFVLLAGVWWLSRDGTKPSQREVADHAGVDVMMTSQVLRVLEARGLVRREPDPTDARAKRLSTTPEGAAISEQAIEIVEATDHAFFRAARNPSQLLAALTDLAEWTPAP